MNLEVAKTCAAILQMLKITALSALVESTSNVVVASGRFVPTEGQDDAMVGECEVYVFSCQEDPDDGDSCGDVSQGNTVFNEITIEV